MSKWRPIEKNCLYVIPDIHGDIDLLNKVLKRILPLRKSDGGMDKVVFLGDYIDRNINSHLVMDRLVELRKEYPEQTIFLAGNHELMVLEALGMRQSSNFGVMLNMWLMNGGYQTVMGYAERVGVNADPFDMQRDRIKSIIPDEHLQFMASLEPYYEEDNFWFVHGGCDPKEHPSNYDVHVLSWDRSLLQLVKLLLQQGETLPWEKTIITGHNQSGGMPIIADKFMMLDCGLKQLLVVEARSREAYMAHSDKGRLVKYQLQNTVVKKSMIRRVH